MFHCSRTCWVSGGYSWFWVVAGVGAPCSPGIKSSFLHSGAQTSLNSGFYASLSASRLSPAAANNVLLAARGRAYWTGVAPSPPPPGHSIFSSFPPPRLPIVFLWAGLHFIPLCSCRLCWCFWPSPSGPPWRWGRHVPGSLWRAQGPAGVRDSELGLAGGRDPAESPRSSLLVAPLL